MDIKFHNSYAIKNNRIGILQYWAFKGIYLFMDMEKGVITEHKTLKGIKIHSKEEHQALYDKRNIREGNERERQFGKVWESYLKIWTDGTTYKTGKYSKDFVRGYAAIVANIGTFKEFEKHNIKRSKIDDSNRGLAQELMLKHHMSRGCTYEVLCDRGFKEEIEEKEIIENLKEFHKTLPADWKQHIMESPELTHFLKLAKKK